MNAHAHTRTHEYTRVRTRVVSVKAVATAGSVAEHGEEGLPRRGNTIHTLTHHLRLASVALIAPRQRGDQKSAGGGGCFPFQEFKNGGWSSIQTSRAANLANVESETPHSSEYEAQASGTPRRQPSSLAGVSGQINKLAVRLAAFS